MNGNNQWPNARWAIAAVLCVAIAGAARADFEAGLQAIQSGDYARAEQALRSASAARDARAQYLLGLMYTREMGLPLDGERGVRLLREAAEQNHVDAQLELARMYQKGAGVPRDDVEMARWYRRAAEQGDVGAQLFIADVYAFGLGVPRDYVQAAAWYEVAAIYWGDMVDAAREFVAEHMTEAQKAEAALLARKIAAELKR